MARHSFINFSGSKIPIQTLKQLYWHSSVTTTIMYQSNFKQDKVDDAFDSVVNFYKRGYLKVLPENNPLHSNYFYRLNGSKTLPL